MSDFLNAWRVQNRVIHAFILRETRTRFGRSKLGYLWAFFEPSTYMLTLVGIFSVLGQGAPINVDMLLFFFTGIIPWLSFVRQSIAVSSAIGGNQQLLTYPQVKMLDIVIARTILEFSTLFLVALMYVTGVYYLGRFEPIESVFLVLLALIVSTMLGVGFGLISGVARLYMPAFSNFQSALTRILFFTSGLFFVADTLPSVIREWLWFNPVLHIIEWSRSDYFYGYKSNFYDWRYPFMCALVFIFVGLAAERISRHKVDE